MTDLLSSVSDRERGEACVPPPDRQGDTSVAAWRSGDRLLLGLLGGGPLCHLGLAGREATEGDQGFDVAAVAPAKEPLALARRVALGREPDVVHADGRLAGLVGEFLEAVGSG